VSRADGADGGSFRPVRGRSFPWVVFALSFGLLLSDYMSRHVLVPSFPELKREWALSDAQLGALSSVVPLVVAALAVPLSLVADRTGRVRAVQAMACLWSVATLACAVAAGYGQLMAARFLLGFGEAAYGAVGLALVLSVFSPHRRSLLTGAFLAGSSCGAVLGVAVGGVLATHLGWRWSVALVGLAGLALVGAHRLLITDERIARHRTPDMPGTGILPAGPSRPRLVHVIAGRPLICAYVGSGLQLLPAGALIAWLPTSMARSYGLGTDRAALLAAAVLLALSLGLLGCGWATDRLSRRRPLRRWTTAAGYSLTSMVFLGTALVLDPGAAQLALLFVGAFFVAGSAGPAGSLVTELTPEPLRATALGTLALANNLLGLAAGPLLVGLLADRWGLDVALALAPLASVAAVTVLLVGRHLAAPRSADVGPTGGMPDPPSRRTVRKG
jgi:MFS family permease